MKKIYKTLTFCFGLMLFTLLNHFTYSQKFVSFANGGGASNGGTLFRINADGGQFMDLKDMLYYPQNPQITLSSNGSVIFGVTGNGGGHGLGTLFSMNVDGTNFQTLYTFTSVSGAPITSVIQATDGNLYGIAKSFNVSASVYKVGADGSGFTVIHNFPLNYGFPGNLYEASDGKLYGLTSNGGTNHYGSIFSVNKDGSGYSDVYFFTNSDGSTDFAPLIQDPSGNFYGVGPGGANNMGQIFKMQSGGSGFTDLFDFNSTSGHDPRGGLLLASDGKIYGTTSAGGANGAGTLFSISTNGTGFQKIYDMNLTDGDFFAQQLKEDANGFLYASTSEGGANHAGSIIKIKTDGSLYQKIYDYENNTSFGGFSSPFVLGTNTIYGVNNYGAANGAGNVFSIQTDGTGYTSLYAFGGPGGYQSYGPMIQGIDSLLYGTTYAGGTSNGGTIFVTNGNGQGYTKLYDFGGTNGINPYGGLVQSANGTLFGTASAGGANGYGILFSMQPNGTSFTKLHDFNSGVGTDGGWPKSCPLIGADGNLYGTTSAGGGGGFGTIYSCKPDGSNFTTLWAFSQTDGAFPYNSLVQDANGTLFGLTTGGGSNSYYGVIFSIHTDGSAFTVLHSFDGFPSDGSTPYGSLTLGQDGNLYGLTSAGGSSNNGTFFSIHPDGTNYAKLYEFSGNAYGLAGSPIQLSNGLFYGIATSGGGNGGGQLFSLKADGSGFRDIYDFPVGMSFYFLNGLTPLKLRKQSINFSTIAETTVGSATVNLSATASSGLPVTFVSGSPLLAQVNGSQVTTIGSGKATITAAQSGDGVYDVATAAQQSFCIDPLPPTISISVGNNTATPTLASSVASGNQWFLNGTAISGATAATLSATTVGAYTVQTTTADGCASAQSTSFQIVITGDLPISQSVALYPNPTKDYVFISGIEGQVLGSDVTDMLGRSTSIAFDKQGDLAVGDVRNLSSGLYILKVTSGTAVAQIKFVKQ